MFVPHASPTEVFSIHEGSEPDFSLIEQGLPEQVGHNLRLVRSQLVRSQQFMADRISVSLSQYRKYEAGKDLPRLHSALLWSIETGIPTHWLFSDTHYQKWLDVPFRQGWVPILYFVNRAPAWALDAFQASLTGLVGCHGETERLTSLQQDRRSLGLGLLQDRYYQAVAGKLRLFRQKIDVSQDAAARLMGISTEAYRRYETPSKCIHFSINLIMRFWVATGTNPIELSSETPVFKYRQKQSNNFRILLPLLKRLDSGQLDQLVALLGVLEPMSCRD